MGVTPVIIAYPHCGTTMLAGIIHILGIPMVGNNFKKYKLEDIDIHDSIFVDKDWDKFHEIVKYRDKQYSSWGFKNGGMYAHLKTIDKYLRDPIYLSIWKDPVSVTRRRYNGKLNNNPYTDIGKVKKRVELFYRALDIIQKSELPVYTLSYLNAVTRKEYFVRKVARILNLSPDEETIKKAISFIKPSTDSTIRIGYPRIL